MSSILVVGSMAFDTIETPFGKAPKILGGSANYFSLAASYFAPVRCVSVVGEDYPADHLELLKKKGIDVSGVRTAPGKTFHWAGRYGYELHEAQTLETCLNVFERFQPQLPDSYKQTDVLFLGNIAPALQENVLAQVHSPKIIALDTMNFWIESSSDALKKVISKCHIVIINEGEMRQLTKTHNIVQATRLVQSWGPKVLVVKRGEYGAVLFQGDEAFSIPGLPLAQVKDPTGAGDTFAGGFLGYLASQKTLELSKTALRKAVVHGCVMASFTVQEFGFQELLNLSPEMIQSRYQQFVDLTTFHLG